MISSTNFFQIKSVCLNDSKEVDDGNYQSNSTKNEKHSRGAQTLIYDWQNDQAEGAAEPVQSGSKRHHFSWNDFRNVHPNYRTDCSAVQSHVNHEYCKHHPEGSSKVIDVNEQNSQDYVTNSQAKITCQQNCLTTK